MFMPESYTMRFERIQAIADATEVLNLEPENGKAFFRRAQAYYEKKDDDRVPFFSSQARYVHVASDRYFFWLLAFRLATTCCWPTV